MNILLIVASGKSSRFGKFPKAFCNIGGMTNADNTIQKAKGIFDKIYMGVNADVYAQYGQKTRGCNVFSIKTGQGDAHSLLKCMLHIKEENNNIEKLVVCWGDAIFTNAIPFLQLLSREKGDKVIAACSWDKHPYAWFEVGNNDEIIKAHFKSEDGDIEVGLHDQSLFLFDIDFAIQYLDDYREYLGIPYDNDEKYADINEMKLLASFGYLYSSKYDCAKVVEIDAGNVYSFNTHAEFENIMAKIK